MTTPFTAKTETDAGEGEEFEVLMISGDDERPGYSVICPSLPGCISQGDNWDHALEMIQEAIEGFLELGLRSTVQADDKERMMNEWTSLGCQVELATVVINV